MNSSLYNKNSFFLHFISTSDYKYWLIQTKTGFSSLENYFLVVQLCLTRLVNLPKISSERINMDSMIRLDISDPSTLFSYEVILNLKRPIYLQLQLHSFSDRRIFGDLIQLYSWEKWSQLKIKLLLCYPQSYMGPHGPKNKYIGK